MNIMQKKFKVGNFILFIELKKKKQTTLSLIQKRLLSPKLTIKALSHMQMTILAKFAAI